MAINQTGLVKFSDGSIPVITLDSVGVSTTIPIALFPDWVNDAGIQAFGGAAVISIFDDGMAEGTSAKVTAVTQQTISSVGGITVPNPQANETYAVRIRLRSAVADVNYVDKVVRFRVVTPLMVPFATSEYEQNQEPGIVYTGSAIQFSATAGAFPSGEIRLQDGRGGIVVPSIAATDWGADAQAFIFELGERRKRSLVTLDFDPSGAAEGYMRITYQVTFDATTGEPTFTKHRRYDFSSWGYFSGSDMSFLDASVDMVAETATATFMRGLYSYGPRFDSAWVIGRNGTMPINPQAIQIGQEIDVSQVVDFSATSHLSQTGLADKHLVFVFQTATQNIMHEVPLRLSGYHDVVAQDGVTNYFSAAMGAGLPAAPPLFMRYLFYPYLELENITQFYDPNDAFLPGPATLGYPRVQNIEIFAGNDAVASQTYASVIDIHNDMASIAMPTIGASRHVLDVRNFTTPIPSGTPFLRVTMEIDTDGAAPVQTFTGYYQLNEDGQPQSWKLPTALAEPIDAPFPSYNPAAGTLDLELQAGSAVTSPVTIRGDLGTVSVAVAAASTATVDKATMESVISSVAEMVEIEYTNGTGTFKRRLGVVNDTHVMVQGNAGNLVKAYFTGTTLVLVDTTPIDLNADGKREIVVVGDGPAILIPDAQDGSLEFINFQQASPLGPDVARTHVDLHYFSGGVENICRIYSNFFDARSANPRTLMNTPRPMFGSTGIEYEFTAFSAPQVRFDLSARTIEFEADGRVYNYRAWRVHNLALDEKVDFKGAPQQSRVYHVGSVLRDAAEGSLVMFVAVHQNGTQRVFTGMVRPKSQGFQTLREVRIEPTIG